MSDDDDLIVLEKSPNLPTLRQIDKVVQKVVKEVTTKSERCYNHLPCITR